MAPISATNMLNGNIHVDAIYIQSAHLYWFDLYSG